MARRTMTNEDFKERVMGKHNDLFDLSGVEYRGMRSYVDVMCNTCKHKYKTLARVLLTSGCPNCKNKKKRESLDYFISKSKDTHGDRYDYSKVVYKTNDTPVKIVCPQHGEFKQKPVVHYRCGCPDCARDKQFHGYEGFVDRATEVHHGKYQYNDKWYSGSKFKINITCNKHGEFRQRPCRHLQGEGCPRCAIESTTSKGQMEIYDFIKSQTNHEVILNATGVIGNQHLDILIPELNVAIEFNGIYWHSEGGGSPKNSNYHLTKFKSCEDLGIQLIQIMDVEWVQKRCKIENLLRSVISRNVNKVFARKLEVRDVPKKEAQMFLEEFHLQGFAGARVYKGLYKDDVLLSIMTFGKNRFKGGYEWELVRYAVRAGYTITGGSKKLFTAFTRENRGSIVSYSDNRFFTGKMYGALGFEFSHNSKPNYFYFDSFNLNTLKLESRNKYQKHKLKNLLDVFDPLKTEYQNMIDNGFDRIWDCGNKVWVYQP